MRDAIRVAIRKTAEALKTELDAGKHKGNEQNVEAAIKAAKIAVGADRLPTRR